VVGSLLELQHQRDLRDVGCPGALSPGPETSSIVVDAGSNVAWGAALVDTLGQSFVRRRRLLIFATTQGKDIRAMLQLLLSQFDEVILTRYMNNPRFVPPEELAAAVKAEMTTLGKVIKDVGIRVN